MTDEKSFQSEVHRATGNVTIHSALIDCILSIVMTVVVSRLLMVQSTIFVLLTGEVALDSTRAENMRETPFRDPIVIESTWTD